MATIEVEKVEPEKPNGAPEAGPAEDPHEAALDVSALVDAHPVGTLATALGVGYVLGGGLFTSLTSRLLRWGLRLGVQLALLPALERELAGLASNLGTTLKRGEAEAAPSPGGETHH